VPAPPRSFGAATRVRQTLAVARLGVRQIVRSRDFLERLAEDVPRVLGGTRTLITYPMADAAFRPRQVLPRMRSTFTDAVIVELPDANHYFVEDAPDEVADAVVARFGISSPRGGAG
jgi:haloalkane dehalogenase